MTSRQAFKLFGMPAPAAVTTLVTCHSVAVAFAVATCRPHIQPL
ncbi:MAG TPA: hypothetical protein VLC92_14555 [Rhodocyclaceae bacterium]|nr:hypothetical protein [Rhodocyclaceae bacterium]